MIYSPRTYSIGHRTPSDQGNLVIVVLLPASMSYLQIWPRSFRIFKGTGINNIEHIFIHIYSFIYIINNIINSITQ